MSIDIGWDFEDPRGARGKGSKPPQLVETAARTMLTNRALSVAVLQLDSDPGRCADICRFLDGRVMTMVESARNYRGAWGGDSGLASSIEGTSVAVAALCDTAAARRGAAWLVAATRNGEETPASPIGFYFARLWYCERLYPLIFATDALVRWSTHILGDSFIARLTRRTDGGFNRKVNSSR
jgi:hypothetical protein